MPPRERKRGLLLDHEVLDITQYWNIERYRGVDFRFWHLWPKLSPAGVPYNVEENPNST